MSQTTLGFCTVGKCSGWHLVIHTTESEPELEPRSHQYPLPNTIIVFIIFLLSRQCVWTILRMFLRFEWRTCVCLLCTIFYFALVFFFFFFWLMSWNIESANKIHAHILNKKINEKQQQQQQLVLRPTLSDRLHRWMNEWMEEREWLMFVHQVRVEFIFRILI